jgi:hypothetical protein
VYKVQTTNKTRISLQEVTCGGGEMGWERGERRGRNFSMSLGRKIGWETLMGNLGRKHGCLFGGGGGVRWGRGRGRGSGEGEGVGVEEIVASAVHTSGQEVKPSLGIRQPVT